MYFKKITSLKQLFSIITYLGFYIYSTYHQFRTSYNIKKMVNLLHNKIISLKKFTNKTLSLYRDLHEYYKIHKDPVIPMTFCEISDPNH